MDSNDSSPTHSPAARLLLVDDHELSRTGLRFLLAGEPGLEIVGEASNGREALTYCRRLQPDLVLMNARMPIMNGFTATRLIRRAFPTTKVLLLSIAASPEYRARAQAVGAAGYLLKEVTQPELVTAIHQVLAGQQLFD
jgi:DNA-binding NarL/FixJ family response regulator